MSEDVIVGYDGRARCAWAGTGESAFSRYHDEVWGARTYGEDAMCEALTLGVFEAGLSWSIVFGNREAFREAFHGFNIAEVAAMTGRTSTGCSRTRQSSATVPRSRPPSTTREP